MPWKNKLNRVIKALKKLLNLERNQGTQEYLNKLSATSEINYSLWKAIKDCNDRRYSTCLSRSRMKAWWEPEWRRKGRSIRFAPLQGFLNLICERLQRRKINYFWISLLPSWISLGFLLYQWSESENKISESKKRRRVMTL